MIFNNYTRNDYTDQGLVSRINSDVVLYCTVVFMKSKINI